MKASRELGLEPVSDKNNTSPAMQCLVLGAHRIRATNSKPCCHRWLFAAAVIEALHLRRSRLTCGWKGCRTRLMPSCSARPCRPHACSHWRPECVEAMMKPKVLLVETTPPLLPREYVNSEMHGYTSTQLLFADGGGQLLCKSRHQATG